MGISDSAKEGSINDIKRNSLYKRKFGQTQSFRSEHECKKNSKSFSIVYAKPWKYETENDSFFLGKKYKAFYNN